MNDTSSVLDSGLSNSDLTEFVAWRRKLHHQPEISGEEEETACEVVAFLTSTHPDRVLTGLGGHGVAVVYDSGKPGPTVLFRAELDALPIEELSDAHTVRRYRASRICAGTRGTRQSWRPWAGGWGVAVRRAGALY